jgi:hypothetical protein
MKVASALLLHGAFFLAHVAAQSCDSARPSKSELWPPNGQFENITITKLSTNSTVVITAVKQDEDPGTGPQRGGAVGRLGGNGKGLLKNLFKRGNANNATNAAAAPTGAPDAVIDGSVTMIKSERLGGGDGRIYYIFFNATDSNKQQCSGNVTVCVPHSQGNGNGNKDNCVDSSLNGGTLYSSTSA